MTFFTRTNFIRIPPTFVFNSNLITITKSLLWSLTIVIMGTVLVTYSFDSLHLDETAANSIKTEINLLEAEEHLAGYSKTGAYHTQVTSRTLHNLEALLNSGDFVVTVSGPDATQEYKLYAELPIFADGEGDDEELLYPLLCIYDTKYNVLLRGVYPVEYFSSLLDLDYDLAEPNYIKGAATLIAGFVALAGFVSFVTLIEYWSAC